MATDTRAAHMQTVLVASSKGGCGKTTLVTHLAAYWAQYGENPVIIDTDRQKSSFRWCQRRTDDVPGVLALDGMQRTRAFNRIPADTGHVLIDTPAGITPRALAPLLAYADVVLVPVLPSAFDFDASVAFLEELDELVQARRRPPAVGLVANRLKLNTRTSHNTLAALDTLPFAQRAALRDSQSYVLLAGLGKGIFDYASEKVRRQQDDWRPLLKWLQELSA